MQHNNFKLSLWRVRRKGHSLNAGMIRPLKAKKHFRFSTWSWKGDWTVSRGELSCCGGWRSTHNSWEKNKALESRTKSQGRNQYPLPRTQLLVTLQTSLRTRRLNHCVSCRTALVPWRCAELRFCLEDAQTCRHGWTCCFVHVSPSESREISYYMNAWKQTRAKVVKAFESQVYLTQLYQNLHWRCKSHGGWWGAFTSVQAPICTGSYWILYHHALGWGWGEGSQLQLRMSLMK